MDELVQNTFEPLQFSFSEFILELSALENLTKRDFLTAEATLMFKQLREQLCQLQTSRCTQPVDWKVDQARPLRTIGTFEYESGKRMGPRKVFGEICWCWQIKNCLTGKSKPKYFHVSGNASIRLRICEIGGEERELARWRVECGTVDSPGCYFHTQVLGDDNETFFPKNVPVPRLPSLFVTPMSAIEFFLGELFQNSWASRLVGSGHDLSLWSKSQKTRLRQLLQWKLRQIEACDSGSPWLALKRAKPCSGDQLFVEAN